MSAVLYEKKGRVAYITLNRPEKLNSINDEMVEELQKAWVNFRDDAELWVAVLAGNGRSFCAGADVTSLRPAGKGSVGAEQSPNTLRTSSKALRVVPTIFEVWKPIICALHGHVYGAGAWLALTCDIRIAADDTKFGAPEVKLSRVVNFAGLIAQYIPKGIASELLLVGDPISPERAYQLGIFNMLVPREELMPAATRLAERLCENGPVAMKATKEILHKSDDIPSYDGKLSLAEAMYPLVTASEDYKEGSAAFKEKRKPVWKGR